MSEEICNKCFHPMDEHRPTTGCMHSVRGYYCGCSEGMITPKDRVNAKHAAVILSTIAAQAETIKAQAAEIERLREEIEDKSADIMKLRILFLDTQELYHGHFHIGKTEDCIHKMCKEAARLYK